MSSSSPSPERLGAALVLAAAGLLGASEPRAEPSHWQTDYGPLFLEQEGSRLRGLYPDYRGEVRGELDADGEWMHGVWVQLDSERRCRRALDGARHWGTLSLRGLVGDRFEGFWAFCDDAPGSGGAWGGRRVGGDRVVVPRRRVADDDGLDPETPAGAAVSLEEARGLMRFEYGRTFPFDTARFVPADLDCDGRGDVAVAWVEGSDPETAGRLRVALVRREGDLLVHDRRDGPSAGNECAGGRLLLRAETAAEGDAGACHGRLRVEGGAGCPAMVFRWRAEAPAGERLVKTR